MNLGQVFMQMARERVAMDRQERAMAEERRQREEEFKNARELQLQDLANDREYAETEWDRQQAQTTQAYSEREAARLEAQDKAERMAMRKNLDNHFNKKPGEEYTEADAKLLQSDIMQVMTQLDSLSGDLAPGEEEEIIERVYGAETLRKIGNDLSKLDHPKYLMQKQQVNAEIAERKALNSQDPRAYAYRNQLLGLFELEAGMKRVIPGASRWMFGTPSTELEDPGMQTPPPGGGVHEFLGREGDTGAGANSGIGGGLGGPIDLVGEDARVAIGTDGPQFVPQPRVSILGAGLTRGIHGQYHRAEQELSPSFQFKNRVGGSPTMSEQSLSRMPTNFRHYLNPNQ